MDEPMSDRYTGTLSPNLATRSHTAHHLLWGGALFEPARRIADGLKDETPGNRNISGCIPVERNRGMP